MRCVVGRSMYMNNDKYYLDLILCNEDVRRVTRLQKPMYRPNATYMNPLNGRVLRVKVPFRYNRVACTVLGNRTVQELEAGDFIEAGVKFCGPWRTGQYYGYSWKLSSLRYLPTT